MIKKPSQNVVLQKFRLRSNNGSLIFSPKFLKTRKINKNALKIRIQIYGSPNFGRNCKNFGFRSNLWWVIFTCVIMEHLDYSS